MALLAISFIKSITSPSCPIIYRKIPAPATSTISIPNSDLFCFNKRYINKVTKSVLGLDYFVLVSKDLTKFYSEKLKDKKVKCVYIPNSINFFPQEKAKLEFNLNRKIIA